MMKTIVSVILGFLIELILVSGWLYITLFYLAENYPLYPPPRLGPSFLNLFFQLIVFVPMAIWIGALILALLSAPWISEFIEKLITKSEKKEETF